MFTWARVQKNKNFVLEVLCISSKNSVATCHRELIQYKPTLLVQICSKHFEGLTRELSAGPESICCQTASKNLPQKYEMLANAALAGLVCTCSELHSRVECTGIAPQCNQGLWDCRGERLFTIMAQLSLSSFASPAPPASYFLFSLASKHSMLTKCIRSVTGCSQRPLTKEIQWGKQKPFLSYVTSWIWLFSPLRLSILDLDKWTVHILNN